MTQLISLVCCRFFDGSTNRVPFGAEKLPMAHPMLPLPISKARTSSDIGNRNINAPTNTYQHQQLHSMHDGDPKPQSQSRQSSTNNYIQASTSSTTRNPTGTQSQYHSSSTADQPQRNSSKKKSTAQAAQNMHQSNANTTNQQQNQFHGSFNESGSMWNYDQTKAVNSGNQPSYQKAATAFSVSKLVGNVENQQQQPRHFVEGLLGKNASTGQVWGSPVVHNVTNAPDQGFGYYQQPDADYFNYNPTYHQHVPHVSSSNQNFNPDLRRVQGQPQSSQSKRASNEAPSYPTYHSSTNQQQQQHDSNRLNTEVQHFPRFQHHQSSKIEHQHSALTNQHPSHQHMQQQHQHHQATSSVSNFNLSSIFPEVNQDVTNRPQQHHQHLNQQNLGNTHQGSSSGHFYR